MEGEGIHQGSNASTEIESGNTENQYEASTSNENKPQTERLVDKLKILVGTARFPFSGIHQGSNASTEIESGNTENQYEASTSNENKPQTERLVDKLKILVGTARFPFSIEWRITRIPDRLRQVKEQAYTPMTISIGPIHRCNTKLQITEGYKLHYFESFTSRFKIELATLVRTICVMESRIRSCYEEDTVISMGRDEFVIMILVDAVFILELFYRYYDSSWEMNDLISSGQLWSIKSDLVLLENQLPFFVLEEICGLGFANRYNVPDLIWLTAVFFDYYDDNKLPEGNVEIKHLTALMRAFQLPLSTSSRTREMFPVQLLFSAAQLYDAGVKFKKSSSSKRLLDVQYHFEQGVLEMPCLELDDQTEALVRNVMALEQFGHGNAEMPSFTDYFFFLDSLINTIEDIDLLCDRGILVYRGGDNKAALSLVKSLIANITWSGMNSDFSVICKRLNVFYQEPVHRWKATLSVTTLKNQYFNNPWRGSATIAACLLLLLTLIQTIMSILQVVRA